MIFYAEYVFYLFSYSHFLRLSMFDAHRYSMTAGVIDNLGVRKGQLMSQLSFSPR